jgi:hypothetical protein
MFGGSAALASLPPLPYIQRYIPRRHSLDRLHASMNKQNKKKTEVHTIGLGLTIVTSMLSTDFVQCARALKLQAFSARTATLIRPFDF